MTREEAKAYLRFEAELMAHLRAQRDRRVDLLKFTRASDDAVKAAERAYSQAMDDMTVFGSLMLDRVDAWDAIHSGVTSTEYAGS